MEFNLFDIIFDNPSLIFQPGQTISGKVLLELNDSVYIEGLKLKLEGRGRVLWRKERNRRFPFRIRRRIAMYHADEKYLSLKLELLNAGPRVLTAGSYEFLFCANLPHLLPGTYRTPNALVEYDAQAIIITTSEEFAKYCLVPFVVINPLDLNLYPRFKDSIRKGTVKNLTGFCCLNGAISLTVVLPTGGFVPGQVIPIFFEVENTSRVTISSVKMYLIQKTRLTSTYPFEQTKTRVTCLAVRYLPGITQRSTAIWNESLQVPEIPIPNLSGSNLIMITYEIRIKIVPSGLYGKLCLMIPVQLGDIPFASDDQNLIII